MHTLEWLLDRVQARSLLSPDTRREIELRAGRQRARILQSRLDMLMERGGGTRYRVSPGELLASFQLKNGRGDTIDEDFLAALVAEEAGVPYEKIDPLKLDMQLVTKTLSRPFALRHAVVPLRQEHGTLVVAVENPFDAELCESLARVARRPVQRVVSSKVDILRVITEVYGFRQSVEVAARQQTGHREESFEQLTTLRAAGEVEATDKPVVNAVDFLLRYAFDQRASDIHIEPRREDSQVRLRIDGVLHSVHTIPRTVHPAVAARIKTLARMDIAEKRRPQDGRIKTAFDDSEIELRVSSLPTAFGEKLVIRIFDPGMLVNDLAELGLLAQDLALFRAWIERPHGLLLITGPTGSGKTTTLYTALQALQDSRINITTIEDPIEMIVDSFNQVAVQPKVGLDFASALRTILRQDPDVIMVGEVRDGETARMATQAALTGHLVLATLHTNDSIGAIDRLVDLEVPRYLIGSTLIGVMAQRLVRRVCRHCAEPWDVSYDQRLALGITAEDEHVMGEQERTQRGRGCARCRNTGFFGRLGLFELLDFDATLAHAMLTEQSSPELRRLAQRKGMRSLRHGALSALGRGLTTAEELLRLTGL
jgi:general secretion pathway protein E